MPYSAMASDVGKSGNGERGTLVNGEVPTESSGVTVTIVGERVVLGPVRRELLPIFGRWFNDFATTRALGDIFPPMSAAQLDDWYEMEVTTRDLIPFAVYERATLTPIGTTALLGIDWRNRTAEFGIIIGEPTARGKGYGTDVTRLMRDYALETLGLRTLFLTVYAFQTAGIRAYEKAGFQIIGRQREVYYLGGRWWDRVYMEVVGGDVMRDA
jgi:diamine N-acetyltransferase